MRKSTRMVQEGWCSLIRDRVCGRLSALLNANIQKHKTRMSNSPGEGGVWLF